MNINENRIIYLIARSLYFADANLMFGWQGWAYKQATEWKRLHDTWANMDILEKNRWISKASLVLESIKKSDELYHSIIHGFKDVSEDRWWLANRL